MSDKAYDHVYVGMSDCDYYTQLGCCGEECPVYRRWECQNEDALEQLGSPEMKD